MRARHFIRGTSVPLTSPATHNAQLSTKAQPAHHPCRDARPHLPTYRVVKEQICSSVESRNQVEMINFAIATKTMNRRDQRWLKPKYDHLRGPGPPGSSTSKNISSGLARMHDPNNVSLSPRLPISPLLRPFFFKNTPTHRRRNPEFIIDCKLRHKRHSRPSAVRCLSISDCSATGQLQPNSGHLTDIASRLLQGRREYRGITSNIGTRRTGPIVIQAG